MTTKPDEALAEQLRIENIDQFNILVKMHLSFVLDLHTDDENMPEKGKAKKWNFVPFSKKYKNRGIMEGAPLTQEGICVVYQLIEYLKKESNIVVEGIFRRTGSLNRQQELRNLLNQGATLDLDGGPYSLHDCASVLKSFLAELPEPLLTEAHHSAYCQLAEKYSALNEPLHTEKMLTSIQLLLLLLPTENRILLKDVVELLHFTTQFEGQNKMSADSLATLFTPHLLCPRKLSPETLHISSQTLSTVLSFMITKSKQIFEVPKKLATDIRAFYAEKEQHKILSPKKQLNESVSDNFAANTVFSFVDRERTAKENSSNPTETALAQLYAHIQSLPESSKKKKLIKQFNKENGHGTPLQLLRSNLTKQNKSISDSIKRHIFHKNAPKASKRLLQLRSSSEEMLNKQHQQNTSKSSIFCTKCETISDVSTEEVLSKRLKPSEETECEHQSNLNEVKHCVSNPDLSTDENIQIPNSYLTSTPAVALINCSNIFTPEDQDRKSMSPITRSTQGMSRAMQETMMTPRSRKPVLLLSGTNINNLTKLDKPRISMDDVEEESSALSTPSSNGEKENEQSGSNEDEPNNGDITNNSLTSTFREYLCSRSILTASPADLSFSSQTDDYNSTNIQDLSDDKLSASLLYCLNGKDPNLLENGHTQYDSNGEKELVLKPKQFDENGQPTVFETSF